MGGAVGGTPIAKTDTPAPTQAPRLTTQPTVGGLKTAVRVTAEGQALTTRLKDCSDAISRPDGQITNCWDFDGNSPCALDGASYGALIGRIGTDGEPFYIGAGMVLYWWGTGELYLAVNDNLPWYGDNKGAYMVLISR